MSKPFATALLLSLVGLAGLAPSARAQDVRAIDTGGRAVLTMCQSWVVYRSCRSYNRVEVPRRIAVGDAFVLDFGSNPKEYRFPVARIVRQDGRCTVLDEAVGDPQYINRLDIAPCSAVPAVP